MLRRQTTGSVVCPSCGSLVGVNDERCFICGRTNPSLWGFAPVLRRLGEDMGFVPLVLWGCSGLYVAMLLFSGDRIRTGEMLSFLAPAPEVLYRFGESGALPVFRDGRWWTILSAGWLHGGLLHILFNMMWVRQLAPATADIYGAGRMAIIYTIAGICGFVLSSVAGAYFPPLPLLYGAAYTIGASANIFGLLGALVYYGHRSGSSLVRREAMGYAVMLFLFGLIMPGVDNFAHAGGFAGGYVVARVLDPLKPERIDHLIAAFGCLAASLIAILVSFVTSPL
jgi:rhomboid protease GluP